MSQVVKQVTTKVEALAAYDRLMAKALQTGMSGGVVAAPGRVTLEPNGDTVEVVYPGCVNDAVAHFAQAKRDGKIGGAFASHARIALITHGLGDEALWPSRTKGSNGKAAPIAKSAADVYAAAQARLLELNKEVADLKAAMPSLKSAADAEEAAQREADKASYEALKAQMAELEKRLGIGVKPAAAPAAK